MYTINNKCIICGCTKFVHKYYGKDYNYRTSSKNYEIIECEKCGLEQVFPLPPSDEQVGFYPKNYYSYNKKSETLPWYMKFSKYVFGIFDNKDFELPKKVLQGQNFLDIGCGDGFNLVKLRKNGSLGVIKGFEVSDKNEYKNDIYYGKSIVDTNFNENFDYIWCNHVFEHVDNPVEFLKKVHSIMNDDGVFVLTLPNVKSVMSHLFGKYATDRDIPRHLFGYSWNIERLLKDSGFVIVDKNAKIQVNSALSFVRMINDKLEYDVRNSLLLKILIGGFFCFTDFIFSCIRNTNQMSFILKKKNI